MTKSRETRKKINHPSAPKRYAPGSLPRYCSGTICFCFIRSCACENSGQQRERTHTHTHNTKRLTKVNSSEARLHSSLSPSLPLSSLSRLPPLISPSFFSLSSPSISSLSPLSCLPPLISFFSLSSISSPFFASWSSELYESVGERSFLMR